MDKRWSLHENSIFDGELSAITKRRTFDAQWIHRIVICHLLDYFSSSMVRFYIRDALRNDRRAPIIPVNNPIRTWALTDDVRYHRYASPRLLTDAHDYRCKRLLRATLLSSRSLTLCNRCKAAFILVQCSQAIEIMVATCAFAIE